MPEDKRQLDNGYSTRNNFCDLELFSSNGGHHEAQACQKISLVDMVYLKKYCSDSLLIKDDIRKIKLLHIGKIQKETKPEV